MQTCRGKGRDNWTTGLFKSRADDCKQNANIIKEKKSRHVNYSVKITAFHCNFDLYFMYTKHLINMHEVSFPLADITYIL